ncbi:hypothetical protein NS263_04680 [Curtobacterium oceanosedimentum]|uniref:Uncharacterized protein n=1 Tax=Curtobacterium oceanosedimentum TaxID=465820 RepID=A0ABR5S9G8_9MICO|nr:hypothetical protein NS263_04680 [Curtobacterium oceanosedimentum]
MSALLSEVRAAIDEVRRAAELDHDGPRRQAAAWLDDEFAEVRTRPELRAAARRASGLWGGMGSFSDAGSPAGGRAVDRLGRALSRARSWFVSEG